MDSFWPENNLYHPKPEFRVECVMCGHNSFAATADTLGELVEIVSLHLRQVKERDYEAHNEYFKEHPGTKDLMPTFELPENTKAILASDLFQWAIERLIPFDRILEVAKTPPFPTIHITISAS